MPSSTPASILNVFRAIAQTRAKPAVTRFSIVTGAAANTNLSGATGIRKKDTIIGAILLEGLTPASGPILVNELTSTMTIQANDIVRSTVDTSAAGRTILLIWLDAQWGD